MAHAIARAGPGHCATREVQDGVVLVAESTPALPHPDHPLGRRTWPGGAQDGMEVGGGWRGRRRRGTSWQGGATNCIRAALVGYSGEVGGRRFPVSCGARGRRRRGEARFEMALMEDAGNSMEGVGMAD